MLVLLAHGSLQPLLEGARRQYDLGWLVYTDLTPADAPEPYAVPWGDETLHALRLILDAEPELPLVRVRGRPLAGTLGGDDELGPVPVAAYEVLSAPPESLADRMATRRQPEEADGGLVHLVTYVDTGGAVLRVECALRVLPAPETPAPPAATDTTAPVPPEEPAATEPPPA